MNKTFHISLPCINIEETTKFYKEELGLEIGRKTKKWFDVNLYGNQITFVKTENFSFKFLFYSIQKETIPSFHFGVILENQEREHVYAKVNHWFKEEIVKKFFFEDQNGEQHSFFVQDPNGYHIEFKKFTSSNEMFAS